MSPFQAFRGCSKGRNLPVAVAAIMTSQFENVPASHDVDVACCFRNSSYEVDLRYYVSVTHFLPLIYVLPNSRQNPSNSLSHIPSLHHDFPAGISCEVSSRAGCSISDPTGSPDPSSTLGMCVDSSGRLLSADSSLSPWYTPFFPSGTWGC